MNVFISYSHADKIWADALRSGLNKAGFEVQNPGNDLDPGTNWHLELGKALQQSDSMIVLLSPESSASASVRAEIEYALSSSQFRDRLIPVLLKPTENIPWILRKQHMIRATKDVAQTVRRVAEALKSPATA